MENNLIQSVYTILGVAAIIGAFKGIDWLISLKYKTKDDCEKCRNKIDTNNFLYLYQKTSVELVCGEFKQIAKM